MSIYLYTLRKARRTVAMDGSPVELMQYKFRNACACREFTKRNPGGWTDYIDPTDERHPEMRAWAKAEQNAEPHERPLFTTDGDFCKGMLVYRATKPMEGGWYDCDKPPSGGETVGELRKVKGRWTIVPTASMLLLKLTAFPSLSRLYKSMGTGYRPTIRNDIDDDHTLLRQLLIEEGLCVFPDPTTLELAEAGREFKSLLSAPDYAR